MLNKTLWLGKVVMILVFAITITGCGSGTTSGTLNGVWIHEDEPGYKLIINGKNWTWCPYDTNNVKGTLTHNNTQIILKPTHAWGVDWEKVLYNSMTYSFELYGDTLILTAIDSWFSNDTWDGAWSR